MSRAHAVAPMAGAEVPFRGPVPGARQLCPRPARRVQRQTDPFYVERALLLWPRLNRARIRRAANDPARIAEIVVRRTSQPYEVILAMLTRQEPGAAAPTVGASEPRPGRVATPRPALRIVRSPRPGTIEVPDVIPA
jgi:hypothetical protein